MEFTIIKNSESHTGYDIQDDEFKGLVPGLVCGWQFEFINAAGEFGYNSVIYEYMMPEEYVEEYGGVDRAFEMEAYNGWKPTGRVVFRGYGVEYYDPDVREWFIKEQEV